MSERPARILPAPLALEVEMFVDKEFADAAKYDNSEVLDESGVFDLHTLVARIYAAGWTDGERAQGERSRRQESRQRSSGSSS